MNTEENKQIMARNIKKYMERKGVSNQMLCDDLGFKYTTFMDWIKGVTYPRIGKVEAMARYFGYEKSDLIEDKENQPIETDELTVEKKAMYDFIDGLTDEQVQRLLQIAKAAFEK